MFNFACRIFEIATMCSRHAEAHCYCTIDKTSFPARWKVPWPISMQLAYGWAATSHDVMQTHFLFISLENAALQVSPEGVKCKEYIRLSQPFCGLVHCYNEVQISNWNCFELLEVPENWSLSSLMSAKRIDGAYSAWANSMNSAHASWLLHFSRTQMLWMRPSRA